MNKCQQLLFAAFILLANLPTVAAKPMVLQTDQLEVIFEPTLKGAADEVLRLYPALRQELEEFFGWEIDITPKVVLVGNSATFRNMAGSPIFVAFAVPGRNLVVIDYTRMNIRPFTLSITLKHELCHLLLHRYISRHDLPKWLDEGVCQWVSDGIGEILIHKDWSGLDSAVLTGRIVPFEKLTDSFPRDNSSLVLAYEQSKSMINYIDRQYGHQVVLGILDYLRNGDSIQTAIRDNIGISLKQLESEWRDHLESTPRWLVFLASHLYGLIFFAAAVLSVLGFIRHWRRRKRIYEKWEEEDDLE